MGRKKRSASWHEQAEALKAEAEKLPHGKEREALETKARQLEITANIISGCRRRAFSHQSSPKSRRPPQVVCRAASAILAAVVRL